MAIKMRLLSTRVKVKQLFSSHKVHKREKYDGDDMKRLECGNQLETEDTMYMVKYYASLFSLKLLFGLI